MPYKTDIIGWMTPDDLLLLEELSTSLPENSIVLEIGSFCGKSSVAFAMSVHPTTKIYCIDPFPKIWTNNFYNPKSILPHTPPPGDIAVSDIFDQNTKDYKNIIKVVGLSPDVNLELNNIDLLFIDSAHKNPSDIKNLIHWIPRLRDNAIISGHDYYLHIQLMPHLHNVYPDINLNIKILETLLDKQVTVGSQWGSVWYFKVTRKISSEEIINHVEHFIPNIRTLI